MTSKPLRDWSDAPAVALPLVIETLNSYLEAATDAVCNGGVLDALLGDAGAASDEVCGAVAATMVAAYLQGAAVLHAAVMQGGKHAEA